MTNPRPTVYRQGQGAGGDAAMTDGATSGNGSSGGVVFYFS